MAEFRKVLHAQFSPTKCVACGDHVGPFIDLEVDLPVYGHLYLCAAIEDKRPGCVRQIARLDNMVEPVAVAHLELQIAESEADVEHLLEAMREEKSFTLGEIIDLVRR